MEHFFIHTVEVLRRPVAAEEDGTPVFGELAPIDWPTAQPFGAGKLDTPRDVSVTTADGSRVTEQRSTVFTTVDFPGRELDTLRVTTARGSELWTCGGISEAEGQHGPHHLEVNVSREVHR